MKLSQKICDSPFVRAFFVAICLTFATLATASAQVYIDAGGVGSGSFVADADFADGTAATHANAVDTSLLPAPVPAQEVLQTERYGPFTYTIPGLVAGQTYTVGLFFSENYFAAAGQREFNVSINGTAVLTNFDIYAATGAEYKAILKSYTATASAAGQIVIAFTNGAANNAKVDAIEVVSTGTIVNPSVSIDSGGTGSGSFIADTDFTGGTAATHPNAVDTSLLPTPIPPQEVLQTERYGPFTYTIPGLVAGQAYSVGLYFSENYFAASGQRAFNVSINGTAVLTNFDIYAATGAEYKAILKTYTATANAAGQIVIAFTNGAANNAKVDAIQIQSLNASVPAISSISPTSGLAGSSVTVAGTNFGSTQGTSTVSFAGTTAVVTAWSATSITAAVPALATGTVNVTVTVGGVVSNAAAFTVTAPVVPAISSITPTTGPVGSFVTIAGSNFGTAQGSSTVKFGNTSATVTAWSSTSITVTVPAIPAGSANVTVVVGGIASNAAAFTVAAPSITSISPATGTVGSAVTISGNNFSATQNAVNFGSTPATVTAWSNTSITVTVPSVALGSINVNVTVGGLTSNAVAYTVIQAPPFSLSIDAGGAGAGAFAADEYFTGGLAATHANAMDTSLLPSPVPSQEALQTERYGNGAAFSYTVPGLTAGQVYSIWLYFDEGYFTAAGQREFGVTVNGTQVLPALPAAAGTFDIVATAGAANKAIVEAFTAAANASGQIVMNFTVGAANNPKVDAIQIWTGVNLPPPVISFLTPAAGAASSPVTITGTNFGSSQGTSTVDIGGVSVAVTAWSNTSITAIVPSLSAGAASVEVVVNDVASNTMPFTVVVPPSINALSPASGVSGNSVTIAGANFGATQGSNTVSFGSATATVTAWSNTSITATVPPCLATGTDAVSVSVGGIASNSVNFTITSGASCVPAGTPISSVLVGQNDWYTLPNNVWPIVGASHLKLVRIGGAGQDSGPLACDNNQGDLIQQILEIRSAGAEPLIQVSRENAGNAGSLAAAAQNMVNCVNNTYVQNGTLSKPVQYWEIGNEPDLGYGGGDEALAAMVQGYVTAIAPAMRDAYPNITILAPALSYYHGQAYGDWLGGDHDISGTDSKGRNYINAISFHSYPFAGTQGMGDVINQQSGGFPGTVGALIGQINNANAMHNRTGANSITYALTEFNMDYANPGNNNIGGLGTCGFINGQLFASFYGTGMSMTTAQGVGALTLDTWSVNEGGGNCSGGDLGFLSGDPGNNPTPRSSYYHIQMVNQYLLNGSNPQYLKTTSSNQAAGVFALATTSNNGSQLSVMIMNENNGDGSVSVSLNGGTTAGGGDTKINVSANIAKAYTYNIPNQSTMVIVYDSTGTLKTQVTYSIGNNNANQPPQVTNF